MAATHETSFPERNRGWFQDQLAEVNQPIRELLQGYSKIPHSDVVDHVNRIVSVQIHTAWNNVMMG